MFKEMRKSNVNMPSTPTFQTSMDHPSQCISPAPAGEAQEPDVGKIQKELEKSKRSWADQEVVGGVKDVKVRGAKGPTSIYLNIYIIIIICKSMWKCVRVCSFRSWHIEWL